MGCGTSRPSASPQYGYPQRPPHPQYGAPLPTTRPPSQYAQTRPQQVCPFPAQCGYYSQQGLTVGQQGFSQESPAQEYHGYPQQSFASVQRPFVSRTPHATAQPQPYRLQPQLQTTAAADVQSSEQHPQTDEILPYSFAFFAEDNLPEDSFLWLALFMCIESAQEGRLAGTHVERPGFVACRHSHSADVAKEFFEAISGRSTGVSLTPDMINFQMEDVKGRLHHPSSTSPKVNTVLTAIIEMIALEDSDAWFSAEAAKVVGNPEEADAVIAKLGIISDPYDPELRCGVDFASTPGSPWGRVLRAFLNRPDLDFEKIVLMRQPCGCAAVHDLCRAVKDMPTAVLAAGMLSHVNKDLLGFLGGLLRRGGNPDAVVTFRAPVSFFTDEERNSRREERFSMNFSSRLVDFSR